MRIALVAFVLVGCAGTVKVPASSERPGASAENAVEVERPAVSIASESTYPDDFETRDDAATESARTVAVDAAPPEVPPTEEEIRQAMQGSIYWLVGEGAQSRCHEYRWTPARQPPHSAELERSIPRGTESFAVLVRQNRLTLFGPTRRFGRRIQVAGCFRELEVTRIDETTWRTTASPCTEPRPTWYRTAEACEAARAAE